MSTFYGSDTFCTTDVGLFDVQVTSPKILIAQRLIRRWTTPRGALALINGNPNFGWDVKQYVNARMTPNDRAIAQDQLRQEALKDEQIESLNVDVSLIGSTLTIGAEVQSAAGPFSLTMNVTQLTIDLIFNFGGDQ